MREPRPMVGARAPLFDRMVNENPAAAHERAPQRVLDRAGVIASVVRDLSRLLNTRSPHPERLLGGAPACVLDYGVPDYSSLGAASGADCDRYAALLARIVAIYEPRLSQVEIAFTPIPESPLRWQGSLSAHLRLGTVREPVSFPLTLHTGTGELLVADSAGAAAGAV